MAEAEEQRLALQEGGGVIRPRFETIAYDVTSAVNQGLADKFRDCDFTFGPDHSASGCQLAAAGETSTSATAGDANAQVDDTQKQADAQAKEKSVRSKSECALPAVNLLVPALVPGAAARSPTRVAGGGGSSGALPQPGAMGMLALSSDFLQAKNKRRDTLAVSDSIYGYVR